MRLIYTGISYVEKEEVRVFLRQVRFLCCPCIRIIFNWLSWRDITCIWKSFAAKYNATLPSKYRAPSNAFYSTFFCLIQNANGGFFLLPKHALHTSLHCLKIFRTTAYNFFLTVFAFIQLLLVLHLNIWNSPSALVQCKAVCCLPDSW